MKDVINQMLDESPELLALFSELAESLSVLLQEFERE